MIFVFYNEYFSSILSRLFLWSFNFYFYIFPKKSDEKDDSSDCQLTNISEDESWISIESGVDSDWGWIS